MHFSIRECACARKIMKNHVQRLERDTLEAIHMPVETAKSDGTSRSSGLRKLREDLQLHALNTCRPLQIQEEFQEVADIEPERGSFRYSAARRPARGHLHRLVSSPTHRCRAARLAGAAFRWN